MSSTDRIDTVTGVHYTGRIVNDTGEMISYFSRTPDGKALGTVFRWNGKWSSAHPADGKHRSLRALSRQMMVRVAMENLDRVIRQWITDNNFVTAGMSADEWPPVEFRIVGTTAQTGTAAIYDAIMNLKPVTAP